MDKFEETNEWIQIASQDLDAAKYLQFMHPIPYEIICFHCQQSAEKYLKAFLVSKDVIIKKTHNLVSLLLNCMSINDSFSELKMPCIRLSRYSVEIRYPYRIQLDDSMMKQALSDAESIGSFVKKSLQLNN